MNLKIAPRLLLVAACMGVLAYGIFFEHHVVASLTTGESESIAGPAFVEGSSYDGYVRRDGRLYDAYSLQPEAVSVKDCKT